MPKASTLGLDGLKRLRHRWSAQVRRQLPHRNSLSARVSTILILVPICLLTFFAASLSCRIETAPTLRHCYRYNTAMAHFLARNGWKRKVDDLIVGHSGRCGTVTDEKGRR